MTPEEHYAEAERLLKAADRSPSESWPATTGEYKADMLAAAQVHATLATVSTHPFVDAADWQAFSAWDAAGRPNAYRVEPAVNSMLNTCLHCSHLHSAHNTLGCARPNCGCQGWA